MLFPRPYLEQIAAIKRMQPPKRVSLLQGTFGTEVSNLIDTVKENKKNYTQRQFLRAKEARKLYHIAGCPTVENFKLLLKQGIIHNCTVTVDDVKAAEHIFGSDIAALKGRTTRARPAIVR